MQFINPDILIVGAGPVGCVLAERSAKLKNWNSLIIEKRNHIAGNCFDLRNNRGLLYHKYGPHYMRFKKKRIFNFLSNKVFVNFSFKFFKIFPCFLIFFK